MVLQRIKGVVLDTNMLIYSIKHKVYIIEEIRKMFGKVPIYVTKNCYEELENFKKSKEKLYSALAKKVIKESGIIILEGKGNCDDTLLKLSEKYLVATNDKELKKRIKEKGRHVLILRKGKYLEVD